MKSIRHQRKLFHINLIEFFIGLGILIRLYFFLLNRSLWLDEAYLNTSIVKMGLKELLSKDLFYFQKAPLGYLLVQKIIITIFGAGEMTLRLFSLLCSIAGLFVFARVSNYFLKGRLVWMAVAIFAFAPPLVFHAVEAKQYSCDLLATVISFLLYIKYNQINNLKRLILWGVYGAILIWFSYPVIFILAGIAIAICLENLLKKNWKFFFIQLVPFFIWLLSFSINFILVTQKHADSQWTVSWFDYYKYFAPILPATGEDITWYFKNFYWALDYPLGFSLVFFKETMNFAPVLKMSIIGAIMLLTGFVVSAKKHRDFYILIGILLVTLLASGLKMYPLKERFLVFLSPIFILFIIKGCIFIAGFLKKKWQKAILYFLVLIVPVVNIFYMVMFPDNFLKQKKSSEKQALNFIQSNFKNEDLLFVYWNNRACFEAYSALHDYPVKAVIANDYRAGVNDFNSYFNMMKEDFLKAGSPRRVWFLYDDFFQSDIGEGIDWPAWYFKNGKPTDLLQLHFQRIGKPVKSFKSSDASVICYELYKK